MRRINNNNRSSDEIKCQNRCIVIYPGIRARSNSAHPNGLYSAGMFMCPECSVFYKAENTRITPAGQKRCKCCNTRLRFRPEHKQHNPYWQAQNDKKRY